jgi:TonB-dependent starch-binding outer membrane protein SusC
MNKKSSQRCKLQNIHLSKLLISLASTFIFMIIGTLSVSAANYPVKGTVIDEKTNTALIGVSVLVEGTTVGAITDVDGNFSIDAPSSNSVLIFSYVGYNTQKIKVNGQPKIKVVLTEDAKNLDEIVVVGYGTQKKSVVTGAIASIKSKDLENVSIPRIEDALKGRTAGVTVVQTSGAPGTSSSVMIRGITSINNSNNSPLYIVDGVPFEGGLDQINKSDIESIEVLKDAASSAIYGTASAAGVILVTTKKGEKGNIKVNLSSYYGIQSPETKLDLCNATEYAYLRNEARINSGGTAVFSDPAAYGKGTDWQAQIFNYKAPIQNHEISFSGGSDKSTFFASFGYFNQKGIVASDISGYERYTARLNSEHKIKKWLTIGNNLTFSHTKSKTSVAENDYFGNVLSSAISLDPITPSIYSDKNIYATSQLPYVKDDNGYYYGVSSYVGQEMVNPLAFIQVNKDNYKYSNNFNGNVYVQLEPINGLLFRSSLGGKLSYFGSENYTPKYYYSATQMNTGNNSYTRVRDQSLDWTFTNTLSYNKKINKHTFTVLFGNEVREKQGSGLTTTYKGISANNLKEASMNVSITSDKISASGYEDQPYRLLSYFGRLNYDYMSRYIFTGIIRRDGSSRFGSNNKFGNFPSASVRWNVQNEDFWKTNDFIDALDIRLGYGVNGSDKLGDFSYISLIQNAGGAMFGSDQVYFGSAPAAPANPDLKWERTTQINLGIDATMFKDLNAQLDLYKKNTNGMLMQPVLPGYVGATSSPWANIASLEVKGIELNLIYNKRINKDLDFSVTGNIAYSVNKITNIGNNEYIVLANMQSSNNEVMRMMVDKPYGMFWGYRTNGIFQTQAEIDSYVDKNGKKIQPNAKPGDFRWKDLNGDGSITTDDREDLGTSIPPITFGITLKANYKDFDILLFSQGVTGNKICKQIRRLDIPTANYEREALGRWTGPGTSNSYPRLTEGSDTNGNFTNMSDFYLEDGTYFRLKTLQIGYSLPKRIVSKIAIDKARIYVSGNNLFTLTKYNGYDPEIGGSIDIMGIDRGVYPQARSYMVGFNLSF